jgi:cytochrome c553
MTGGIVAAGVLVLFVLANSVTHASARLSPKDRVERGRYLVHQVGMCIDCHSPRDETGQFVEALHLTGSPIPFQPTVAMPWMPRAPAIAGLPAGYTEEDTVRFLMTGKRPNGLPPALPPMPPYQLDQADAEAVAAYLQSLRRPSS